MTPQTPGQATVADAAADLCADWAKREGLIGTVSEEEFTKLARAFMAGLVIGARSGMAAAQEPFPEGCTCLELEDEQRSADPDCPAHGAADKLADALDDFHFERKQVVELRAVLGEVFTCLNTADMSLLDADQVDEWRERAGLDQP